MDPNPDAPNSLKAHAVRVNHPDQIADSKIGENNSKGEELGHEGNEKKGIIKSIMGYFKKDRMQNQDEQMQQDENGDQIGIQQDNYGSDRYLKNYDEDEEEEELEEEEEDSEIHLSRCGHLIKLVDGVQQLNESQLHLIFEEHKISYDQFSKDPQQFIADNSLVIKIEDQYYDWFKAAPLILSLLAFKQPLPDEVIG